VLDLELFVASAPGLASEAGRRRRREGIRGIGPVHPRQVVQRDTRACAVVVRPDSQHHQYDHHRHAQHSMRLQYSEIDQDDHRADWQPIADDGEGPRITGIPHEDQAAD